ncbi:Uncharacterised protein [uncultured archaeon]|nr:Uncharacterised protein [uncultured archaeon]
MIPQIVENKIVFNKERNALDNFVISFTEILDSLKIDYVIVSGYVAIIFGRSRATEDIDVLIEPISKEKFSKLYSTLIARNYWIINATTEKDAFEILEDKLSIRIADNKKVIPNLEVKFVKDEIDRYSLDKKIRVEIGDKTLFISPLEMQIAYKLYLSGEKDIEDAYFLFSLFKNSLNKEELKTIIKTLKVEDPAKKYLRELYGN